MKQIIYTLSLIITSIIGVSCVEEIVIQQEEKVAMTFKSSFNKDTKVALIDEKELWWTPGDMIAVNGDMFKASVEDTSFTADFIGETSPSTDYYAVYPYLKWDETHYNYTLNNQQTASRDNLPYVLSAAHCTEGNQRLQFHHLLGYIKFTITEESLPIKDVVIKTNNRQEGISGKSLIDYSGAAPKLILTDPYDEVRLTSSKVLEAGDYYIALYPGTYSEGLSFIFMTLDGRVTVKTIYDEIQLQAGFIQNIGVLDNLEDNIEKERNALIALYRSTGGDNWNNKTNWCSDKPVSEWYGISTDSYGLVKSISLISNNLDGTLPEEIGDFKHLDYLQMFGNNLSGTVPASIANLKLLSYFNLANNNFEGEVLKYLTGLSKLGFIYLTNNNFSGSIPDKLADLKNLYYFDIINNRFSGELSERIIELQIKGEFDDRFRFWIEPQQNGFRFTTGANKPMTKLTESLYIHPEGLALEYRRDKLEALPWNEIEQVTKKVYDLFADQFDYIVFMYNVENEHEIGSVLSPQIAAGLFHDISNSIEGIGKETYSYSKEYGSEGRLKGIIQLSTYRQIKGAFKHEIAHNFGAFDFGQETMNKYGEGSRSHGNHWGISSIDGQLGGFDLSTLERCVDGVPNKYRASSSQMKVNGNLMFTGENESSYYYSPLELYLMGFIPPEDVPDIHYFTGVSGSANERIHLNGIFYAEQEHVITIDDIIKRFGKRKPDFESSQKDYRCLVIVVTDNPVDDRRWALMEDDLYRMQAQGPSGYRNVKNFYEATGGRGTMTFDGLESLIK